MPMRITVIGAGHLGLSHAACMAELGHDVLAVDVDQHTIAKAARGESPFFEAGLESLLRKVLDAGRLRLTTNYDEAADFGDLYFLCVGTPQAADGSSDLHELYRATETLAPLPRSRCLIVGKSTVPVGTARKLLARARSLAPAGEQVELAWNPEFLREGHAVADGLAPSRLVFGVISDWAAELLGTAYAGQIGSGTPALCMDLETAELVKLAANAFLATRISFINAMADICDASGADVTRLAEALSYDKRIGSQYMAPGLGYGGGCLPKDVRAFRASALSLGVSSAASMLEDIDSINLDRRRRLTALAREAAGGAFAGKRVAVLGLAFKPDSDDVRDSPSLDVCERIAGEGAIVTVHDPAAMPNASRLLPRLRYAGTIPEAARGADLVLHLTEWAVYKAIDPSDLAKVVSRPVLVDARCALDAKRWREAGWTVRAMGLPADRPMDGGIAAGRPAF